MSCLKKDLCSKCMLFQCIYGRVFILCFPPISREGSYFQEEAVLVSSGITMFTSGQNFSSHVASILHPLRTCRMSLLVTLVCIVAPAKGGTGLYMGPYFKDPQTLNITVHQDTVAYLPCVVRQLGNKKVSILQKLGEEASKDVSLQK